MVDNASRFSKLAAECAKSSGEAIENVKKFISALEDTNKDREGISLLEVKNREMVAYLSEVAFLMERMSCAKSIANDQAVFRAAKHRTVIERIRPIEDKMRSQIDKLTQVDGSKSAENGAAALRARPDQMELDDSDESGEDEEEEGEEKSKKYVPPKMTAVHYDEDEDEKGNKMMEKARRRMLQSSLIQELKQQYSDAPVEYRDFSQRKHDIDKAREEFEEDNLVRLRVTKADKAREARMTRDNAIEDLLNFGNYMMRGEDGEALTKKRKAGAGGGPGGKKSKMSRFERKKVNKAKGMNKQKRIKRRQ